MAIPTLLAPFNATFDPDPDEGYQFTLSDAGGPLNNAFFVPEEGGTVEITLTNATFADPSIIWSNPLDGPAPPPTEGGTKITLPVTAPGIFFGPSVFRINAIPDVLASHPVRSQNIYLAKSFPLGGHSFFLDYEAGSGNFALLDSPTATVQDGLNLDNTLAMINTVVPPPGSPPFLFTVTLNPPPTSPTDLLAPSFNSPPVAWGIDPAPDWLQAFTLPKLPSDPSPQVALFVLYPAALGQSVSLQFSLDVPTPDGGSITVLSPDPIIMNATIGDG
jgi:hypothetical protein